MTVVLPDAREKRRTTMNGMKGMKGIDQGIPCIRRIPFIALSCFPQNR
jgi:hypothetical protein